MVITILFEVWQFRHDCVVRFRRRFRWSPGATGVSVGSGTARFLRFAASVDMIVENDSETAGTMICAFEDK